MRCMLERDKSFYAQDLSWYRYLVVAVEAAQPNLWTGHQQYTSILTWPEARLKVSGRLKSDYGESLYRKGNSI